MGTLTIELRADCANCVALCCVALPFQRSADFGFDKPAGVPCRHLDGFACGIHDRLRDNGFRGCATFDCLGAGQAVTRHFAPRQDWRSHPEIRTRLFDAFARQRQLHELLWYLREAVNLPVGTSLQWRLAVAEEATNMHVEQPNPFVDLAAHRARVADLLRETSREVRGPDAPDRSGADLAGADLRDADLAYTDFRNAILIGTDLRGVALTRVDLLGADLRDADLRGADLSTALFLTPPQLAAARTDSATRLRNDERP